VVDAGERPKRLHHKPLFQVRFRRLLLRSGFLPLVMGFQTQIDLLPADGAWLAAVRPLLSIDAAAAFHVLPVRCGRENLVFLVLDMTSTALPKTATGHPDGGEHAARYGHQQIDVNTCWRRCWSSRGAWRRRFCKRRTSNPETLGPRLESELDRMPKVSGPAGAPPGHAYVTPRLTKLLERAEEEARQLKDEYISVETWCWRPSTTAAPQAGC